MADRESNTANAFETTLTSDMGDTDLTANVETTSGGPSSPAYLVIDPDDDSKREIIYFDGSFTSTSFSTTSLSNRYLDGSAAGSGIIHNTGAKVVSVPVSQLWVDANDRTDAVDSRVDTHDHDGVSTAQVDHGVLLNLLDDVHTQYAKLAGDTFTGAVTFQALGTFEDGALAVLPNDTHGPSVGPSSWPSGLSWQGVTTGSWPALSSDGWVVTFNFGSDARTTQFFFDPVGSGAVQASDMYMRRWRPATSDWSGWAFISIAQEPGSWEVDSSTEVASQTLTTSYASVASVSLTIPSDWGSWRCEVRATFAADAAASGGAYDARIRIDGTDQQAQEEITASTIRHSNGIGGRRAGITTTGSRTVHLMARESASSGSTPTFRDIFLHARAVRTG